MAKEREDPRGSASASGKSRRRQQFTWEYRDRHTSELRGSAIKLFCRSRWPEGVRCPYCDSDNIYHRQNPVKYTCRDVRDRL